MRDLLEGDTGTLSAWGTKTQSAACDFGGAGPETMIDSGPPNPSDTRGATFQVSSNAPGASFECKLDAADYAECSSPQSYSGLADGSHTFLVRAVDTEGNIDTTPASYSWQISVPPPTSAGGAPSTGSVDMTAPNFAPAPTEEHLTDALTRGLSALAGCGGLQRLGDAHDPRAGCAQPRPAAAPKAHLGVGQRLHPGEHHSAAQGREAQGHDIAPPTCRQGRGAR